MYLYQVCAFGDSSAPYIFNHALKSCDLDLRNNGHNFTRYIDDYGFKGDVNYHKALQARQSSLRCLTRFGMVLGARKCPLPDTDGVYIGYHWSTATGVLQACETRRNKVLKAWDLCKASPTSRSLAKVAGSMASLSDITKRIQRWVCPVMEAVFPTKWDAPITLQHL